MASRKNPRFYPGEAPERFCDRLKIAVGDQSIRAFSRKAGLSPSVVHQYLSGKSEPTRPALVAIADAAECSLEWLAAGRGCADKHARVSPNSNTNSSPRLTVTENTDSHLKTSLLLEVLVAVDNVDAQSGRSFSGPRKARLAAALYEMFQHLPAGTPIPSSAVPVLLELLGDKVG